MATVSERLRERMFTGYQGIKSLKQATNDLVSQQSYVAGLLCRVRLNGKCDNIHDFGRKRSLALIRRPRIYLERVKSENLASIHVMLAGKRHVCAYGTMFRMFLFCLPATIALVKIVLHQQAYRMLASRLSYVDPSYDC